jgi:hypothetical protein
MSQKFEIIDRRGKQTAPPPEEVKKPITADIAFGAAVKHTWKNVGYAVVIMGINGNQCIAGRAIGLRSDGEPYMADYLFSPIWEEGFDWTAEARKRLDTFLGCACSDRPCPSHELAMTAWMQGDINRINECSQKPVPEAIEMFIDHQRKKPNIVIPGR